MYSISSENDNTKNNDWHSQNTFLSGQRVAFYERHRQRSKHIFGILEPSLHHIFNRYFLTFLPIINSFCNELNHCINKMSSNWNYSTNKSYNLKLMKIEMFEAIIIPGVWVTIFILTNIVHSALFLSLSCQSRVHHLMEYIVDAQVLELYSLESMKYFNGHR